MIKYFSAVTAFVFFCAAMHSDIYREFSHVCSNLIYLAYIMSQLLLSRAELAKCIPSILMYSCDHIICPGLSILFLYTPAHKA